jgi:prevent-host-death family protein
LEVVAMTMVSSREFNRDVSAVKRAAASGPVIITDHGRPSHVLLSFADYQRLTGTAGSLGDAFVLDEDIDLEPVHPQDSLREVDL